MAETFSSKLLTIVFFLLTIVSVVLISKAGLTALKTNSSVAYSIVYFLLFGAAFVFTKRIFHPAQNSHKYLMLSLFLASNILVIFFILKA
jgi:uncharacterized membrane protein